MQRFIGRLLAIGLAMTVAVPGTAVMAQNARSGSGERAIEAARVDGYIEAAKEAQQKGDWREAAAAWSKVTDIAPDNGQAWFNLGYTLHAAGQLEKAIKVHKRAAEFDDYEGIALYNLGCAYALSGRQGKALDALEASAEAGFDVADAADGDSDLESVRNESRFRHLVQAAGERARGRTRERVQDRVRDHIGGMMGGGRAQDIHSTMGEIFGTIQSFLAENAPKTERMFIELAQQAARTLNMLRQELAENEDLAPIAEMIGQWMGGGRDRGTMSRGGAAREHDDDHGRAHEHDGDERHAGDHDHAGDLPLRERADASPEQGLEALAEAAQRHQRAGDWDEAIVAWRMLLEQQPDIGGAWFNLGYALHARGDLEDAVKIHKKAAQYEEFEGIAMYNLGCAYALMGQKDRAFRALRAAHEAGFDIADSMPGDSDLDSLRDDDRYEDLLRRARDR